ncbi:MAG: hypothetical protein AAFQ35_09870 [Pseudomonadota bacterium]
MAATASEFARGLVRLGIADVALSAPAAPPALSGVEMPLREGTVLITYTPRPGRRLSPLITMPAAEVTLAFTNVAEPERRAFVDRFDRVFQRGGG